MENDMWHYFKFPQSVTWWLLHVICCIHYLMDSWQNDFNEKFYKSRPIMGLNVKDQNEIHSRL